MQQQQHSQKKDTSQGKYPKSQKISPVRMAIIIVTIVSFLAAATIWILSVLNIIAGIWATIIPSVLAVLGTLIGFCQWYIPLSSSQDAVQIPLSLSSSAQVPRNEPVHRRILSAPPLTDPRTIQQRDHLVSAIYTKLIHPDTTGVVLTGIGGVGKSTLAALVYKYTEEQRKTEKGPFRSESLWLHIDKNTTFLDLAGTLFDVVGKPLPNLDQLAPSNQVLLLINALNTIGAPRLVVLDQFESLLDWETGQALPERPGIGEFIDILNSQKCCFRFLLTSRSYPKGLCAYPPSHMGEYHDTGLTLTDGMELLCKQGVEASEMDLCMAVESCEGHALALTLLASILRRDTGLKLPALFGNPIYTRLWKGDIASNLLDYIYRELLDKTQREVLLAFSTYREPVSLDAVMHVLLDFRFFEVPEQQIVTSLNVLLTQHLIQSVSELRYQPHAIVSNYVRDHVVEGNEQANTNALCLAHIRAARFYEQQGYDDNLHPLVETVWHLCQAGLWQEAHNLIWQRDAYFRLKNWRGNAILMELYQLLLPLDKWCPPLLQEVEVYKQLGVIYRDLGRKNEAQHYFGLAVKGAKKYINEYGETVSMLSKLAEICEAMGNKDEACEYYEEALGNRSSEDDLSWQSQILLNLGHLYDSMGKREKACEYCKGALADFRQLKEALSEGIVLNTLGNVYSELGQREKAYEHYEEALDIFRKLEDYWWEGATFRRLGTLYSSVKKEEAYTYYRRALDIYRRVKRHWEEGLVLEDLGRFYFSQGKPEEALQYYQYALDLFRELGAILQEGMIFGDIALVYMSIGQNEQALQYYEKALRSFKDLGDCQWEGKVLYSLAQCFMQSGQINRAYACAEESLEIFKELEDFEGESAALGILGTIDESLGLKEKARECYEKSLAIHKSRGNKLGEGAILNILGQFHKSLGQREESRRCFEDALGIFQSLGDREWEGTTLNNLGGFHSDFGQATEARKFYEDAVRIFKTLGNRRGEGMVLKDLGQFYGVKNTEEACKSYSEALRISRELGNRIEEISLLNNLGSVYSAQEKREEARLSYEEALKMSREMKDHIWEITILCNLGNYYHSSMKQSENALTFYKEALRICEDKGFLYGEKVALCALGQVYKELRKPEEACKSYEKAVAVCEEMQDYQEEGATLYIFGIYLESLKRKKEALAFYEKAHNIFKQISDYELDIITLTEMGNVYSSLKKKRKACEYYEEAWNMFGKMKGDSLEKALKLSYLGLMYSELNMGKGAYKVYKEALRIYRILGDRQWEITILVALATTYDSLKEYEEAFQSYKEALEISKGLHDGTSESRMFYRIGMFYFDRFHFKNCLACLLLARSYLWGDLHVPNSNLIEKWLDNLYLGVDRLLVKIDPIARRSVDHALHEGLRGKKQKIDLIS